MPVGSLYVVPGIETSVMRWNADRDPVASRGLHAGVECGGRNQRENGERAMHAILCMHCYYRW